MANDLDFERALHSNQSAPDGGLFETHADKVMRRVDQVLDNRNAARPMDRNARRFLLTLKSHQGKHKAIPLERLCEMLNLQPREGKEIVQTLRLGYGIQIGASRDAKEGGYYLIATADESVESTSAMYAQAVAMLRVVARMRDGVQTREQLLHKLGRDLTSEQEVKA